jgi:hypothetical protein
MTKVMRNLARGTTLLLTLVLAGLGAQAARADPPTVHTFSSTGTDTELCPGITITETVTAREIVLQDSPGVFVDHINQIVTLQANGKTLTDNDAFNRQITGDVTRVTGTDTNIQVPGGGNVVVNAGIIIVDANGIITFEGGPHPLYHGDVGGLCDYLRDP